MLIVIEGSDGSGKETQTKKLYERLISEGKICKKISFPNYESEASAPVKMYLEGRFGKEAGKVNPYPISTMYAIDRYASFKEDWEKDFNEETLIITDRYTTSNMLHQATKLDSYTERDEYIDWLKDLEYEKMKLPVPELVIYLDMPPEKAEELRKERKNKITGEKEQDIHEKDKEYLRKVYTKGKTIAMNEFWEVITCTDGSKIRTIEDIHEEIYKKINYFI